MAIQRMCIPKSWKPSRYGILRSSEGHTKNLMEIPAPPSRYSVAFLRSTLSQAKGYVRPIQQDITLESGGTCQVTQDL